MRSLRVSLAAANKVSDWSCLLRVSEGSPRNCEWLGEGGYEVTTFRDARVLRPSGLPAQSAKFSNDLASVQPDDEWHQRSSSQRGQDLVPSQPEIGGLQGGTQPLFALAWRRRSPIQRVRCWFGWAWTRTLRSTPAKDREASPGLVPLAELDTLVERIHANSHGQSQSRHATGAAASNLDLYTVNCTFRTAVAADAFAQTAPGVVE